MCVVSRCCSKAAILVQAAEDEVDYAISWECFGMAEQVQCREAPVDAGDAEVFSEMIFELFAALLWTLVVSVAASYYRGKSEARILCPDFGCRLRACRRRVSALPAAGCWLRRLSRALLQATCRVFVSTICRRQLLFEVNRGSQRRFRRGVKYSKLLSSRADGLQATCNLNSGAYSGRSAHLTFYLSGEVWSVEKDSAAVFDYEQHMESPTSRSGEVHLERGNAVNARGLGCRFPTGVQMPR